MKEATLTNAQAALVARIAKRPGYDCTALPSIGSRRTAGQLLDMGVLVCRAGGLYVAK